MKELKSLLEDNGFEDVLTYIQSGNILFNVQKKQTESQIENEIHHLLLNEYDYTVPVIVLKTSNLKNIIENNPFINIEGFDLTKLYVTFFKNIPSSENIVKIKEYDYSPDKFIIKDNVVYVYCPYKYGKTKLSNNFFEKKLEISATTRNWKTINEVIELSK